MKILFLTPYSPLPANFGGAIRIYNILKHLANHHNVTVAGYGSKREQLELENEFPSLRGKIHFCPSPYTKWNHTITFLRSLISSNSHWYHKTMNKEMDTMLQELVRTQHFDIIQSEFPVMANFNLETDAIKILDAHNVEYDNFRRMAEADSNVFKKLYFKLESQKFYREEVSVARKQDAILTVSERDAKLFEKDVPDVNKCLVPNGIDMNKMQRVDTLVEPFSLVFVGMMKYFPNDEAMRYFLDEVFPLIQKQIPQVKIYIVGGSPAPWLQKRAGRQVEVTGYVEDVRPYISKASAYVVPLNMGGGTRLKILEAMAMEIPLVTTTIGCEGIPLKHQETALIADTPETFAQATIKLLLEEGLRSTLTTNAYELVTSKFSWEQIHVQLEETYTTLLGVQKTEPTLLLK